MYRAQIVHPRRNAPAATFMALVKGKIGIDPAKEKPKTLSKGGKTHPQKTMLDVTATKGENCFTLFAAFCPSLRLGAALRIMFGSQRENAFAKAMAMATARSVCCPVM